MNSFNGPIFIISVDRSGTTLLNLMLDTHPEIAIPYESQFITDFFRNGSCNIDYTNHNKVKLMLEEILAGRYVSKWDERLTLNDINLNKCIDYPSTIKTIYETYAYKRGKFIWGDKDPYYVEEVDILYNLFPDAKFIFLIRDGRDVAMSITKRWWGPDDFISCLRYWERKVLLSYKMLSMLPENNVYHISYEDLVLNTGHELNELCQFIGVDYVEKMSTDFSMNAMSKVGADRLEQHHAQLKVKPGKQHLFKWKKKLSKCDQAIAHEIVGQTLSFFGYKSGCTRHLLKPFRKIYHYFVEVFS